MHRQLLPGVKIVDHEDRDGLNNRRKNLRDATPRQNVLNRKLQTSNKSGYRGVHTFKGRYRAQIQDHGRKLDLGTFSNPIDAARAYDKAARKLFGNWVPLNFQK